MAERRGSVEMSLAEAKSRMGVSQGGRTSRRGSVVDYEKGGARLSGEQVENLEGGTVVVPAYTEEDRKRILRKIDFRLVPMLGCLYLIAFIDRGNIGNAKVAGLVKDLKLVGLEYNIALTMFFIPYALLEVPSNIILKMMRPSIWISILMFCWGLVMTLMGIIQNKQGLYATRFCLGIAESGFFPAATYLLTIWYLRYEVQSRMAVFYAGASLSGAFSGLLAFAIEKMNGIAGLEGWRWIFILEGLIPIVLAFITPFALPDKPATASFLTEEERDFIRIRLEFETGSGAGKVTNDDKITFTHVKNALKEWRIWAMVIVFYGNSIGVYGFTYTVPSVILGLGYTAANAQLLTIPVYVFAMIVTLCVAFYSDKVQQRSPFIIGGFTAAACGFIALIAIPHPLLPGLTYGFLFLAAAGLYCPLVCIVSWIANNLAPSSKRAVGMALLISIGNLGGIAGSNIYLSKQEPHYWLGYGFSLGVLIAAIIMAIFLRGVYLRDNKKRDDFIAEHGEEGVRAMYTDEDLMLMGDRSPFFRYTV